MQCYFCTQEITGPIEYHHPDKEHSPDWTEPTHPECHTRYHQQAGHFQFWGAESPYAGRPGYEKCIVKWPGFHRMGGLARARSARRDKQGRFVAETRTTYIVTSQPTNQLTNQPTNQLTNQPTNQLANQRPSDIPRRAYHEKVQAQTEKMTAGPYIADDGLTIVVPSEWYNEDAKRFWYSKGFEWRPETSTWERDTRKPLYGRTYTAEAWLEATRHKFYQFWPGLLKRCRRCGRKFLPISTYQIHCLDCCA